MYCNKLWPNVKIKIVLLGMTKISINLASTLNYWVNVQSLPCKINDNFFYVLFSLNRTSFSPRPPPFPPDMYAEFFLMFFFSLERFAGHMRFAFWRHGGHGGEPCHRDQTLHWIQSQSGWPRYARGKWEGADHWRNRRWVKLFFMMDW